MLSRLQQIAQSETLRKKILFTLGVVVVYKLLATIPVPGVNVDSLVQIQNFLGANSGLKFFSSLMGGGLEQFSIVLMGLSPYINAVIILQLLAVVIPQLEAIKKEGEQGQRRIQTYTRWLTLPLALAQSYGMIVLFNSIVGTTGATLIDTTDFWGTMLPAMLIITGGTMLLVWLGDLISESGIGNGSSVVIFAGVLAGVPQHVLSYVSAESYSTLALLTVMTAAAMYVIIRFTEGARRIPLMYARTGKEEKSYFPIRVNQAGMVPIIFAVSLVTFPELIGRIMVARSGGDTAQAIGTWLTTHLSMQNPSWYLIIGYFILVLGFSYFYVSIVFNTTEISENIQRRGGYIPGVRPGRETAEYLEKVSARLNFFGGSFLAFIAVFPYLFTRLNNEMRFIDAVSATGQLDFLINGAGLIIVVGVILDIMRRVDTELKSYDYRRFI